MSEEQVVTSEAPAGLPKRWYVVHAYSGMEKAVELQPDLILMDMNMPVMDGNEATFLLRSRGYKGLIVALSASASALDSERSLEVGCDYFCTKPIDTDFENIIRELLEERR